MIFLESFNFDKHISGGTIPHVYFSEYGEESIYFPEKAEQEEIGDFFANFDEILILSQRKLEAMKEYKKALMQLLLTGIVRVK